MAEKTLRELLSKYVPNEDYLGILTSAKVTKTRLDKEKRILEVYAELPNIVKKETLYALEAEVAEAYSLTHFKIFPHYPSELFSEKYISQILLETERVGVVARGFFTSYKHELSEDRLVIKIPFFQVSLLEDANTASVIENIIFSEFSLKINVDIENDIYAAENKRDNVRDKLEIIDKQILAAERSYNAAVASYGQETVAVADDAVVYPRLASIYGNEVTAERISDTRIKIGSSVFDVSEPNFAIGVNFAIDPIPIASVNRPIRNIVFLGEVFNFTKEANRAGDKFNISFGIFDGNASIYVKNYAMSPEDAGEIAGLIKAGMAVAVHGYLKTERKDDELYMSYTDIAVIVKEARKDKAEKKRVELHLHTNMSSMDALIPPDVAVKTAKKWGHPAVAITDHGNVQGFPEAMIAADKNDMKVIYGMEAYFVNDTASAINGHYEGGFDDEFIVFDLETTGLNAANCKIIEIGAARIKGGKVLETYDVFVDPECDIPPEITELTSITDDMVRGQPKIAEALPQFLEFVGDRLMIAHNADFDMGFLRVAAKNLGLPFKNASLDTVALSRYVNPDLKKHKLNILAEHYGLGDFHHHRASDDAEMLAMIFFEMIKQLEGLDINSFTALESEMSAKADPLQQRYGSAHL